MSSYKTNDIVFKTNNRKHSVTPKCSKVQDSFYIYVTSAETDSRLFMVPNLSIAGFIYVMLLIRGKKNTQEKLRIIYLKY